jgi:hypothetical protein
VSIIFLIRYSLIVCSFVRSTNVSILRSCRLKAWLRRTSKFNRLDVKFLHVSKRFTTNLLVNLDFFFLFVVTNEINSLWIICHVTN